MNVNEILSMPAGREMDALILASVFDVMVFRDEGGEPYRIGFFQENEPVWNYSGNISSAWAVVEKLAGEDSELSIHITGEYPGGGWRCVLGNAFVDYEVTAETAPLAICRAALLARGLTQHTPDKGGAGR